MASEGSSFVPLVQPQSVTNLRSSKLDNLLGTGEVALLPLARSGRSRGRSGERRDLPAGLKRVPQAP